MGAGRIDRRMKDRAIVKPLVTAATRQGVVIVIDDDEAVRGSLRFLLEIEGHEVFSFADAFDALRNIHHMSEGCLVVDYVMPGMTGLDLVDCLRGRDIDLPVILMTSIVSPSLKQQAGERGVTHIVEKPLRDNALLQSIEAMLA